MSYITGKTIKQLRECKDMTQKELARKISVSDKTISKWETSKGLPDIGIIEDLAKELGVSIAELLTGDYRINDNQSANMRKTHFYVCPVCGNIITSVGKGSFSCCGISLPEQEVDDGSGEHSIVIDTIEDEYCITLHHTMTKQHYISFVAYVTSDHVSIVKLYPEQDISVRFRKSGHGIIYAYCNRDGLFRRSV